MSSDYSVTLHHMFSYGWIFLTAEDNSLESDRQKLSKYYVLSGQCYLTEAQEVKMLGLVKKIRPEIPVLVVQMKKSNVNNSRTLVRKLYHHILCKLLTFCRHVQFVFYLGKSMVLL